MRTVINVNRHIIAKNKKHKTKEAPLSAKTYRSNQYGHEIDILDKDGNVAATLTYNPDKPLKCGATAYLTTNNKVVVKQNV